MNGCGRLPLNSNPMKTLATGACSVYFLPAHLLRQEGETGCHRTEENIVTPSPPSWVWPSNHSLPATRQALHPHNADVTSLNPELQRTCPLRVPGGAQELLNSCLTQSCCPSFGVPRPGSISPEPRSPTGRDVLYCRNLARHS